ncbi:hypothetical protein OA84_00970 [Kaistella solincola]|uniref:Uncharacterized protein n=1 Tax=Kaistella solincola TaxID=510955 RepID=A0ABR4ZRK7_9FLAO|nr:hypothetical protein OA84_00970 [Kaistella solincola]
MGAFFRLVILSLSTDSASAAAESYVQFGARNFPKLLTIKVVLDNYISLTFAKLVKYTQYIT